MNTELYVITHPRSSTLLILGEDNLTDLLKCECEHLILCTRAALFTHVIYFFTDKRLVLLINIISWSRVFPLMSHMKYLN